MSRVSGRAPSSAGEAGRNWQLKAAQREGAAFGASLEASRSDIGNDNAKRETLISIRMTTIYWPVRLGRYAS